MKLNKNPVISLTAKPDTCLLAEVHMHCKHELII